MAKRKMSARRGTTARRGLVVAALAPLTVLGVGLSSGSATVAAEAPQDSASTSLPAGSFVTGQLLVRFAPGMAASGSTAVNAAIGATTARSFSSLVPGLQLVQLPPSMSVSSAMTWYAGQPGVRYAQPNWVSHIEATDPASVTDTPNDPRYGEQWGWAKVDAPTAWNTSTGSHKVVVMDVDTGLDYNHEDLAANAWQNTAECKGTKGKDDDGNGYVDDCHGIDTINGDSDPIDDNGHGTHTGGTIGAVGDNKVGVTGFNWSVQVMPCKSHDSGGSGSVASIIECFAYAKMEKTKFGYDIAATNNSYGSCPEACDFNPATYDAIAAMVKPGVVMAFAAGNSARDNDLQGNYPSNYDLPNIIAVAATTSTDTLASFSQWGLRSVDVGAPGASVLSTLPNDSYGSLSGTSMATPHVAGLAALLHAADAKLAWWQIRNLIIAGGDRIDALDGKTTSGRRINAAGSMKCSGQKVFALVSPMPVIGSIRQKVSALNIDCAKPAGAVTVKVTPGNTKLSLSDNGHGGDFVAGDGIYTATWTPKCDAGNSTFTFSNGKKYDVKVVACAKLSDSSGGAGDSVKVSGTGYGAGEVVDVFFDSLLVGTVNADGQGKVSTTMKVPGGASKGWHLVVVSGQTSGLSAAAPLTVK